MTGVKKTQSIKSVNKKSVPGSLCAAIYCDSEKSSAFFNARPASPYYVSPRGKAKYVYFAKNAAQHLKRRLNEVKACSATLWQTAKFSQKRKKNAIGLSTAVFAGL